MHTAYQLRLNPELQDLTPILAGTAKASFENWKSPCSFVYTLIHYVTSGRGYFTARGKEYEVHTNQAFIMLPGETASFRTCEEDPWSLRWVGFVGKIAHHFAALPPVFDIPQEVLLTMCDLNERDLDNKVLGYRVAAELLLLYSLLLEPTGQKPDYVQLVTEHIHQFHTSKISVAQIASSLGLNRSYLSDLFKKKTGMSIQQYLLKTRIETSKRYLLSGTSIKEAALLSGFSDVSNYNKLFSRESGNTPSQFRKNAIRGTAEFHNKEK